MISNDMPRGQMGHLLPMMPNQDRRQFPAFRATTPSGQAGGQFIMQNNPGLNVNQITPSHINVASPAPPMPPLMLAHHQNVLNNYLGHNVVQQRPEWPAWSPLLPKEASSTITSSTSGTPMPLSGRPSIIVHDPTPPPTPMPPPAPTKGRPKGKPRNETQQQKQPPPPPQPPQPLNQMDTRPRGRPRTKGRHQQPQPLLPSQPRQQPPQAPQPRSLLRQDVVQRKATTPQPQPGRPQLEANQGGRRQQNSNVGEMTSQLASIQSISRAMKQFGPYPGPRKKSNRKKASNVNAENNEQEDVIEEPNVDHISTGEFDHQNDDCQISNKEAIISDDQISTENFEAERLSSLQLKTARRMLDKERDELKRKKMFDMFNDERTEINPYTDHYDEHSFISLYLAAYIISTPGCHEVFLCKSCDKEIENRQGFRKHNHTKTHLRNLKNWCRIVKMNDFEDIVNNVVRKISKAAIKRAEEAIAMHQEYHTLARARFYDQCTDQVTPQNDQEEERQIEVIDLAQQINEQHFSDFSKATQAVKDLCPGLFVDFKKQIINLLSVMYFDKDKCDLQIQFNATFYDAKKIKRHWIPKCYDNIRRRSNYRHFMKLQLDQEDLSFAKKSNEQLEEIKTICGMARLLFPIFLECQFVPNAYVILLAVLMDTNDQIECDATSTQLENGWVIDLLLRSGIAILNPTTDVRPIIPTEPEIEHQQDLIIPDQAESSSYIHLPNSVWSNEEAEPSSLQLTQEQIFTSENSPQTFLSSTGMDIESDLLLNQTRIRDDIKLSSIEVTTETHEETKHDWTLNQDNYQKSYSSYSSTTSIQSLPGEDATENTIEEHDYYLDDEEVMDHEIEVSNVITNNPQNHLDNITQDNSATISVPNLTSNMTHNSLEKLFRNYGPIKKISIESSKKSTFRNGNITFFERCNARSAMISMNNTEYRHKKFNIVMSEKKIKLLRDYQNRMEETPLENLTNMVQNLNGESSNLLVDPETENACHDPEEETKLTTSIDVPTKKSCKRKIKSNLLENSTKSSKPDIGDIPKENQSEIVVEIDASSSEDQSEEGVEIHTEFKLQCSVSSPPPDPIYLAHCLFAHWEEQLNFYEDVDRTKDDAFTMETINHLAILVDNASSHRQTE